MEPGQLRRIGGKFQSLGNTAEKMSDPQDQFYQVPGKMNLLHKILKRQLWSKLTNSQAR